MILVAEVVVLWEETSVPYFLIVEALLNLQFAGQGEEVQEYLPPLRVRVEEGGALGVCDQTSFVSCLLEEVVLNTGAVAQMVVHSVVVVGVAADPAAAVVAAAAAAAAPAAVDRPFCRRIQKSPPKADVGLSAHHKLKRVD
jgi:hypothetical protein